MSKIQVRERAKVQRNSTSFDKLRVLAQEERRAAVERRLNGIRRRFEAGKLIDSVLADDPVGGRKEVEKLAGDFSLHPNTLMAWRRIAATYDEEDVASWMERRLPSGHAITFTHLGVLSRVFSASDRASFMKSVFEEGLSSMDLLRRIRSWEAASWAAPYCPSDAEVAAEVMTTPFRRPVDCDHGTVAGAV